MLFQRKLKAANNLTVVPINGKNGYTYMPCLHVEYTEINKEKIFRSKFLVDPAYPKPIASTIAPQPTAVNEELQYPLGQGQATRKQYED